MHLQHAFGIFTVKFFKMDLFCFKCVFSETRKTVFCKTRKNCN